MAETNRPYETKDVTLASGNRIRYYEWPGPGPNLILLHGSSGYGLMYEWAVNHLGNRFHVFAPDQRGHGDSDKPDGDYSADEYAEDVHLFIQALGLGRAIVGGHSLGGRVSQVFAATYPDECLAIILVGGLHLSNFYHERARAQRVMESAHRTLTAPAEFASREAALEFLRGMRRHDTEASHAHRIDHNMDRVGVGYKFKFDPVRVAQGLNHQNTDLRKYAPLVRCPVAILRSSEGSELTTHEAALDIAKLWQNATVTDVEGDYLLHVVSPGSFAAAVTQFIDSAVRD